MVIIPIVKTAYARKLFCGFFSVEEFHAVVSLFLLFI